MLIKKLSAIAAISGICTLASTGFADETAELKALLLKQQKQLEALQQKVEKQQTVHNEALTHYIQNEIDRALEAKGSNLLTLGSHVENLTIKGDFRVRYENRESDNGESRDRFRQRFRLGFLWKTNEGWEIGAGLATGDQDGSDSGSSSATSANDTYSQDGPFETGGIFLDYAYAKHNWDNGFSLTLGQHKNPYVSSSVFWDSDVRFVGATGQWSDSDSGLFATGGAYIVQTFDEGDGDNDDANLYALQAGIETGGATLAVAYYHFDTASSSHVAGAGSDNSINILSGYAEYAGKTDSFNYKVFGEYSVNIGADDGGASQVAGAGSEAEDENVAFVLGGEIGIDKWKFKYAYAHIEADSLFGPLTDSTFGTAVSGTGTHSNSGNVKGHILGIGYKVTKNFSVSAKYIVNEQVEGDNNKEGELLQLNFLYKF